MAIEGMPLALLVNPPSAGGRTLKLLPRVEHALDALRIPFRVERTKGLEHGVARALQAVEAGEVPVVFSGDGLIGAVGGAMAGSETPMGIVPGGRGNDLARVLGIPDDPDAAVAVLAGRTLRLIDVGEANGKRFLGIVSVGFDSEANRLANETEFPARQPRLRLRRHSDAAELEAGPIHDPGRRRALPLQRLLGLGRQQPCLRRRHVHRPAGRARRRRVRRRHGRRGGQAALRG